VQVVALVCNFTNPTGYEPPVLNHAEVEALFHEFGHALHSLLSRTVRTISTSNYAMSNEMNQSGLLADGLFL
jgi:Zn-dependent oligopeptidase